MLLDGVLRSERLRKLTPRAGSPEVAVAVTCNPRGVLPGRIVTRKRALLILAIVTSPLLLFGGLSWLNTVNPLTSAFVDSFEVANATSEPLWISPVGALADHRVLLPQYGARRPTFPVLWQKRISLPARSSVRIAYDADDVVLSELAVEAASGQMRELPVGEGLRQAGWLEVVSFAQLPPVSEPVRAAVEGATVVPWLEWFGLVCAAIPVGLFAVWLFEPRRA
jgi:hypothetical protein